MGVNKPLKEIITIFGNNGYTITQDNRRQPKSNAIYFRITNIQWRSSNGVTHKIHEEVVYKKGKIGVVLHHNGILKDFESYLFNTYTNNFKEDKFFLHKVIPEEGLIFYECNYDATQQVKIANDVLGAYKDMHKRIKQAVKYFYNYVII